MNRNTKLVVLDVDDTLYLERDYVRSGFDAVGAWVHDNFGVLGFGPLAWSMFCDGVRANTFNLAAKALSVPQEPAIIQKMIGVYRQHSPNITVLPDALRFMAACQSASIRMAVITDGPESSQAAKVSALGLSPFCDTLILTARLGVGKSKPHPMAFLEVSKQAGVMGAECVYIADNPKKDFVAPMSLGWQSIRMRRVGGLHYDVASPNGVERVVSSFDELWRPSS